MARLRSVPLALALSISSALIVAGVAGVAEAGRDRGDSGGGGGRLGQVSSGLGRATSGGTSSGGGASGGNGATTTTDWRDHRDRDYERTEYVEPVVLVGDGGAPPPPPTTTAEPRTTTVDFYLGAQKVYESDESVSADLAFNEGRFRVGASISRYFERQRGADALTFTIPTLYLGFRIDDGGPTRVHLEVGAVGARTRNDPEMDSSVGGLLGGVRVEHHVSPRVALVGDAQAMMFEQGVRAGALRAGLRYGHLQASLRYLDLNVGPALFGPEVGFSF